MANIKLDPEEIKELFNIYNSIKRQQAQMGSLYEQIQRSYVRLTSLRGLEEEWDKNVEQKYHLPSGTDWRVDPSTGSIIVPSEEDNENTISENASDPEVKDEEIGDQEADGIAETDEGTECKETEGKG